MARTLLNWFAAIGLMALAIGCEAIELLPARDAVAGAFAVAAWVVAYRCDLLECRSMWYKARERKTEVARRLVQAPQPARVALAATRRTAAESWKTTTASAAA